VSEFASMVPGVSGGQRTRTYSSKRVFFLEDVFCWFGCGIIWAAARTHNKVAARRGLLHQLSYGLAAGVDAGPCYLVAVAAAASPWPRPSSDGEEIRSFAGSSEHRRMHA
jgi:hypothetical protein